MSDFLQQMLNHREHNRKLIDAQNKADLEKRAELTRRLNADEIIPSTPELRELAQFLWLSKLKMGKYDYINFV